MLAFLVRVFLLLAGLGICFVVLSYFLKNIKKQDATATAAQMVADAKDKAISIVVEAEATASELLAGEAASPKSSKFTSPPADADQLPEDQLPADHHLPADHLPAKDQPESGTVAAITPAPDIETKDAQVV